MVEREAYLDSPVAPAGSWIKHWLSCHFRSQPPLDEDVQSDRWSSHPFCSRKRLVVALLVILALVAMVMLLLLNYYCIMVWKMCYQEETAAVPKFGSTSIVALETLLLFAIVFYSTKEPPKCMYGIVLDAGSSHTAMYIYRWPADKLNGTGVVTQHSECHVRGGGISGYAGQPGAAGRSLEGCLKQAMMDVPPDRHRRTPVYLGAGMRHLK